MTASHLPLVTAFPGTPLHALADLLPAKQVMSPRRLNEVAADVGTHVLLQIQLVMKVSTKGARKADSSTPDRMELIHGEEKLWAERALTAEKKIRKTQSQLAAEQF